MSAESELDAPLQFDRAVHADAPPPEGMQCARCKTSITDTYFNEAGTTLCAGCGKVRQHMVSPDRSAGTLMRAALFGLGAAGAGALLYYAVMAYLELEIGIVALAIGYLVGRAVAKSTRGRSARRHRMLALGLTYFSVAMAYAPFAIKEMKEGIKVSPAKSDSAAAAAVTGSTNGAATLPAASNVPADSATKADVPVTFGGFMLGFAVVFGIIVALPMISALSSLPGGLLSILIIGYGMWQAWTIAGAANSQVTGPYDIGIGGEAAA